MAALIERETGIRLSLQAVSVYWKRWGFTAQRPMKRAIERREPEIRQWLETDYPALVRRAKAEKAEIQWADETGLSNQANLWPQLRAEGQDTDHPPSGRALLTEHDLKPHQSRQAQVHGL